MVKYIICIAGGMTTEAGLVRIAVIADFVMLFICLRIGVARDASELPVVGRIFVTIHTSIPFPFVLARINGKILSVVIKCRRRPGIFRMTSNTIRGEL